MGNMMTDQLYLATKEDRANNFLFVRLLKPLVGWSQVVFRGALPLGVIDPSDATHSLSLSSRSSIIAWKSDTVILVYRGPRSCTLTGTISTKDSYKRSYEIPLTLVVANPSSVAKAYRQEKDPANQAIDQVKSWFENRASRYNHDQIIHWDPPFEECNISWLKDIGIKIQPNGKPTFREDRHYSELARIRQEKLQKRYEYDKKAMEGDFARQEETKNQIHKICSDLLQVVADGMKETLKERVHEGFERGYMTSEIWDELFTILYAIGDDDQPVNLEKRIGAHMEALRKTRMKAATDFKDQDSVSVQDTEPFLRAIEQDGASDSF